MAVWRHLGEVRPAVSDRAAGIRLLPFLPLSSLPSPILSRPIPLEIGP